MKALQVDGIYKKATVDDFYDTLTVSFVGQLFDKYKFWGYARLGKLYLFPIVMRIQ